MEDNNLAVALLSNSYNEIAVFPSDSKDTTKASKADWGSQSNYAPPQGLCIYGDSLSLYFRALQSLEGIQALTYTVTRNTHSKALQRSSVACCPSGCVCSSCFGFGFTLIKQHVRHRRYMLPCWNASNSVTCQHRFSESLYDFMLTGVRLSQWTGRMAVASAAPQLRDDSLCKRIALDLASLAVCLKVTTKASYLTYLRSAAPWLSDEWPQGVLLQWTMYLIFNVVYPVTVELVLNKMYADIFDLKKYPPIFCHKISSAFSLWHSYTL